MRLLGLDPGLRTTGWGVIDAVGNGLSHVANGTISAPTDASLAERLAALFRVLEDVVAEHRPEESAVEETFVNRNPASALKLGHARGIVMLAPALAGVPVHEYSANVIKKSLVGAGHAGKQQVAMMVRTLLPGAKVTRADAADALAVAICHAHHRGSQVRWAAAV
jgi:crossover junction endodeoxyribonuclease RuvC